MIYCKYWSFGLTVSNLFSIAFSWHSFAYLYNFIRRIFEIEISNVMKIKLVYTFQISVGTTGFKNTDTSKYFFVSRSSLWLHETFFWKSSRNTAGSFLFEMLFKLLLFSHNQNYPNEHICLGTDMQWQANILVCMHLCKRVVAKWQRQVLASIRLEH